MILIIKPQAGRGYLWDMFKTEAHTRPSAAGADRDLWRAIARASEVYIKIETLRATKGGTAFDPDGYPY